MTRYPAHIYIAPADGFFRALILSGDPVAGENYHPVPGGVTHPAYCNTVVAGINLPRHSADKLLFVPSRQWATVGAILLDADADWVVDRHDWVDWGNVRLLRAGMPEKPSANHEYLSASKELDDLLFSSKPKTQAKTSRIEELNALIEGVKAQHQKAYAFWVQNVLETCL